MLQLFRSSIQHEEYQKVHVSFAFLRKNSFRKGRRAKRGDDQRTLRPRVCPENQLRHCFQNDIKSEVL